jgi:hypothetical protein
MNDPYSLVITDEEKQEGIRRAAMDLEEFYRRHPEERPAAEPKEIRCRAR